LFIALARASGISARFMIGFPLTLKPADAIPGYHRWAEFYVGGQWIPVDASEAWKHPQRHDYYFGNLDADRVAFTMGRYLTLSPPQEGRPVNFLIYPLVQVDGRSSRWIASRTNSNIPICRSEVADTSSDRMKGESPFAAPGISDVSGG